MLSGFIGWLLEWKASQVNLSNGSEDTYLGIKKITMMSCFTNVVVACRHWWVHGCSGYLCLVRCRRWILRVRCCSDVGSTLDPRRGKKEGRKMEEGTFVRTSAGSKGEKPRRIDAWSGLAWGNSLYFVCLFVWFWFFVCVLVHQTTCFRCGELMFVFSMRKQGSGHRSFYKRHGRYGYLS